MSGQVWVGKDANYESYEQLRNAVSARFASSEEAFRRLNTELNNHIKEGAALSAMHTVMFARIQLEILIKNNLKPQAIETEIQAKQAAVKQAEINLNVCKALCDNTKQLIDKKENANYASILRRGIRAQEEKLKTAQNEHKSAQTDLNHAKVISTHKTTQFIEQSNDLRLALAATYAYGTNEIACNYYLALAFMTNENRIGNTQWFYTVLSYFNFSRLTVFKLVDGINQIMGKNSPAPLNNFLDQMSIAGAALYGVRIVADLFFVLNAASNAKPKQSWSTALWIALQKDNRHHRMFNNALWFAIMVVRLTCVEMMKNVSPYVFCAGYLIDLFQNLRKANVDLNNLKTLKNELQNPKSAEALAVKAKITKTKAALWEDSRLYLVAYLGTLLGASAFAAKALLAAGSVGAIAPVFIPAAIAITGLLSALIPLYLVYGKDLFQAKHAKSVGLAIALTLIAGVGLSLLLFMNPSSAAVMTALLVGTAVLGLVFTGCAQALFTCNHERMQRLWSINGLSSLVIPALASGAMLYIAFFPASMPATIGISVAALFITMITSLLTNKRELEKGKEKSLDDIPTESQFIKGMKPLTPNFFKPEKEPVDPGSPASNGGNVSDLTNNTFGSNST